MTVFTSFFGAGLPKSPPQKPGSLFLAAGLVLVAVVLEPNMFDGFNAFFVLVQPRFADWFIVENALGDFFLIRAGSLDHGIDGHFHCTGTNQLGTESVIPERGESARHGEAKTSAQKMATNRQVFEAFILGFHTFRS